MKCRFQAVVKVWNEAKKVTFAAVVTDALRFVALPVEECGSDKHKRQSQRIFGREAA